MTKHAFLVLGTIGLLLVNGCSSRTDPQLIGKWKNDIGTTIEFSNDTLSISKETFKYRITEESIFWETPDLTLEYYYKIDNNKLIMTSALLGETIIYYRLQ